MATEAAERRRRKNRSKKKTERRRRRKNRSKEKTNTAVATTTTVHDLPEHILERILLCLGPSPCLVRAAAACLGWCRVVADAGFLARLCSAHPHGTRLGHYLGGRCKSTVFVPFLPAAAIVVPRLRRFNLDILPGGRGSWELLDSRGSLLLLANVTIQHQYSRPLEHQYSRHLDLFVYEPLTGRHQAFVGSSRLASCFVDAYLVDGGGDDSCRIGKSIFRVLVVAHGFVPHVASVFSSGSDGGLHLVRAAVGTEQSLINAGFVGRANGSIYWGIRGRAVVLALDETTGQFSSIELPNNIWGAYNERKCSSRIIGGQDGALRIVRFINNELKVFVRRRHPDGSGDEWVLEKHLGLPEEATMIGTAKSKYVILTPMVILGPGHTWLFSVELDTWRVKREHETYELDMFGKMHKGDVYPYELPWPPVLPDFIAHKEETTISQIMQ